MARQLNLQIYEEFIKGKSQQELAEQFNVPASKVYSVIREEKWLNSGENEEQTKEIFKLREAVDALQLSDRMKSTVFRHLRKMKITSLEQLKGMNVSEIRRYKGLGKPTIDELLRAGMISADVPGNIVVYKKSSAEDKKRNTRNEFAVFLNNLEEISPTEVKGWLLKHRESLLA